MGNSCSSGQAHKDKDNASQRSEESPSYQLTTKKSSVDATAWNPPASSSATPQPPTTAPVGDAAPTTQAQKKPQLAKVIKGVANSSISDTMSLNSPVGNPGATELDRLGALGLPSATQALPDPVLLLMLGRAGQAKPQVKIKKIVIYVSAADSQDCCVEKGLLHSDIGRELRIFCRAKGWQVHIVDLHWRTPLEAQRDHEFPRLCLSELARHSETAYVIPVLFLNSSLGTPLLPLTIESSDFRAAVDNTESEDDRQLLNRWYEVDSAASPPCFRLTARGDEDKGDEERRLLNTFQRVLSVELRDAYLTTVVEQEVHNTVLMSQELARRCLWINRMSNAARPEHETAGEKELQRRLANLQKDLKCQLIEKHIARAVVSCADGVQPSIPEHGQYLAGVKSHLSQRLRAVAEAVMDEHATRSPLAHAQGVHANSFEELNEHVIFCQKTAQSSVNRESILNKVKSYIMGDSTQPMVVVGPGGSGKSTLIARAAQCCHQWSPDAFLAFRFVGITNKSCTMEQIMATIINQCSMILSGTQYTGRYDLATLCDAFQKIVAEIAQQRPTYFMVDSLDQIQDFSPHCLDWIPSRLPDNVKIVLTAAEGPKESGHDVAGMLRTRLEASSFMKMPLLENSEARSIVMSGVVQYNHSVNATIQECVLKSVHECRLPLHAKILAWRTSVWQAWVARAASMPGGAPAAGGALAALEELCGEGRLRVCLAALTAARHGLADHEMVDILARDRQFHSIDTYLPWAPAAIFWARASARLAPFLRWGGDGRARWRDRALREAAEECFFPQVEAQIRQHLLDYFQGTWHDENDPSMVGRLFSQENRFSPECFNARKLEEIPYQRYHLCKSDLKAFAEEEFFTSDNWIYDKITALGCGQLLEDLNFLQMDDKDENTPEHVKFLREFLHINSYALNYDAKQFYTLMRIFLENKASHDGIKSEICLKWYENAKNPPIHCLVPLNLQKNWDRKRDIITSEVFDAKVYDLVVRLEKSDGFVASLSTQREEICVWDVAKCKKVRTLHGVTQPINLIPIDQYRCVVLCRRELRVFDLNQGTFITPLKGVMNQKMPYYGLHDPSHLVCLSRNRMYVNLMNTDTGDCVTTFKAGEDRFLNSLLVSGDGRILVCGDETQKPFPLLVWNLSSRKLLYDLRIPHHDFITSLAAITHEGKIATSSYVCVVALELDEPAPNFIVVYDLQSGTLFKKWKPGRDTASLAISSNDGCVVSGLDDARILVWDLVTGNCRFTLWGHTAAVTCLRLAPGGGHLLSSDSNCRDRSVRLWDLNNGTLISMYTPPERISSCEIMAGGKHIVLALESHKELVTLKLVTAGSGDNPEEAEDKVYGDPENDGKVFDLKDVGSGC